MERSRCQLVQPEHLTLLLFQNRKICGKRSSCFYPWLHCSKLVNSEWLRMREAYTPPSYLIHDKYPMMLNTHNYKLITFFWLQFMAIYFLDILVIEKVQFCMVKYWNNFFEYSEGEKSQKSYRKSYRKNDPFYRKNDPFYRNRRKKSPFLPENLTKFFFKNHVFMWFKNFWRKISGKNVKILFSTNFICYVWYSIDCIICN